MIEGVDYSSGAPGSAALLAAGKHFVVRYLARDWRGITPQERAELESGGIDIAVVYESTEQRPLDGREAGASDARFAQDVLVGVGLPPEMPIYFAADWDFSEDQQLAIDDYLRGCADSIGSDRVGIYGGYHVIGRCHANGTAKWFWQTSAWSGGMLQPWAHLYQYAYNDWIAGTNCDDTKALQDTYGQASKFGPGNRTRSMPRRSCRRRLPPSSRNRSRPRSFGNGTGRICTCTRRAKTSSCSATRTSTRNRS
jgi:hypothetical protein